MDLNGSLLVSGLSIYIQRPARLIRLKPGRKLVDRY